MREVIRTLNKHSIAEATGISYNKLRKYASGQVDSLTDDEVKLIYKYLINTAQIFGR